MQILPLLIISVLLISVLSVQFVLSAKHDETIAEYGAKGQDVVEASIKKIHDSRIFSDDKEFLRRVAYVETTFGLDDITYRQGYHGGIWQVGEPKFKFSQFDQGSSTSISLKTAHAQMKKVFGIDWLQMTWPPLRAPFYSALAARLFILTLKKPIPEDIEDQAHFWHDHYNQDGDIDKFINKTEELIDKDKENAGKADLMMIVDSSGSITSPMYEKAKFAVANVSQSFPKETANIGVTIYSEGVKEIVPLINQFTMEQIADKIEKMPYLNSGTNTYDGMMNGVEQFRKMTAEEVRPGVPRIEMVLTDGKHSWGTRNPAVAAQNAAEFNITTIAVGIGSGINNAELRDIANHVDSNVIVTSNYNTLVQKIALLIRKTIDIPQKPEMNATVNDFLKQGQKRYYQMAMPVEGEMTLSVEAIEGDTRGFYSFSESPSSALYDGKFGTGLTLISEPEVPEPEVVKFLSIFGLDTKSTSPLPNRFRTASGSTISGLVTSGLTTSGLVTSGLTTSSFPTSGDKKPTQVYITIEGMENVNNYTLQAVPGDQIPPEKKKSKAGLIVGIVIAVLVVVGAAVGGFIFYKKRH